MSGDEVVVMEMRIGAIDAVNLSELVGAQRFVFIEAPDTFEQALAAQDFMQTGDAASVAVRGIEEGGVAIGDFDAKSQQVRGGIGVAAAFEQSNRTFCPHRPMTEQTADDASLFALDAKRREEVRDDVIDKDSLFHPFRTRPTGRPGIEGVRGEEGAEWVQSSESCPKYSLWSIIPDRNY
jgi:hypothetical protein